MAKTIAGREPDQRDISGNPARVGLYIHYGCHFTAPPSWRNFDASPTLRFERLPLVGTLYTKNSERFPRNVEYGDIVRGLPVASGSCGGVYASHVLEHLPLASFRIALRNTLALLMAGGIFRLVVPDLGAYVRQYIAATESDAAERFMRQTYLGVESADRDLKSFLISWLGNSRHLWMWDEKGLVRELEDAGFVGIRRCQYGDCDDPKFREVENPERFIDAVAMECRKSASWQASLPEEHRLPRS